VALIVCISFSKSYAQKQQLWLDYQVSYPFAVQHLFEVNTSYQSLMSNVNRWTSFSVEPTYEYLFFTNFDGGITVPTAYTRQIESYNTFGTSVIVYGRFHITQNKRVNTRFLVKMEKRYFCNLEENTWDQSGRMRLKAEATIAINGPNLFQDKLWYAMLDYEEFFVVDDQVDERYANRRRARAGAGYRLSYKHRFEVSYTLQSSRNHIEEEFTSIDNVLQLKYKMYLNPARPATTDNP
jgi:hypothetical protein